MGWLEERKKKRQEQEQEKARKRAEEAANPSSRFATTQIRYTDPSFEHPPPLNYTLKGRKRWILLFWSLVAIDCIALPLALYFGLWYETSLSHNAGELENTRCQKKKLLIRNQYSPYPPELSERFRWSNTSFAFTDCGRRDQNPE